jgi:hypothetical protein
MATRAEPFQFLLAGLRDPDTLLPLAAGKVYFYETGTTTQKNVWTEDDKTNAYTSFTLDSNGVAELFGDGNYKVVVKDSAGATEYTFDPVKMGSSEHLNRTVSTSPITVTPEDDLIICDTSSNAITLQPEAVANFTRPVKVKVTSSNYDVTWDPNGAETVDGSSTVTLTSENDSGEFFPDQTGGEWKQANRLQTLGTAAWPRQKILNIENWNMYSSGGGSGTTTKTVAHGLTASKIRSVDGVIQNDSEDVWYPIAASFGANIIIAGWDATNITLIAAASGAFDLPAFDDDSDFTRGWLVVHYVD